ncbi:Sister chromatid cohesion 1 protein [Actinidia chinensis var. chinensis]|uniref:Sister chromatid cohesion 1 protein n=1 Tax=Actinidia chinensis var. chinensis TaxID=1590841 RepID=A0A2R6RAA2_ACTCC|nr:Sister chromatid cohesion 1 protein [Actinidia chinensis var. chinensis]
MFYSHTFLARKGPLGTVWCAAHLQHRLKKSHYTSTDIPSTVERIMYPEVPIALRMSGHLLLGVVRIYSKKVDYLYQDYNFFLISIRKAFSSVEVNLPEDATHAPFHSVTLPDTFELDALTLDDDFYYNGVQDNHLRSQEDITLIDQIPIGRDPYITITFNEEILRDSLRPQDASESGVKPMEEDTCPSLPVDPSAGFQVPSPSNEIGASVRLNGDSLTPNIPEIEVMRDAVHDFHVDNFPLWPDRGNDVIEPDRILEQQLINEKEILTPAVEGISVSGGQPLPSQQHGEPFNSAASDQAPDIFDSHISFGHVSPELAIRSTPPVDKPKARPRKRKQLYDENTVLRNRSISEGLDNCSDLRRTRKCCPSSALDVWKSQNKLRKENIFLEPLMTGLCTDLCNIYKKEFISEKPHLVSVEEACPEPSVAHSPPCDPMGSRDMEIERLRNYDGPIGSNTLPEIIGSPSRFMPSEIMGSPNMLPHRDDFTPAPASAGSLGSQSEPKLGTTVGTAVQPTPDLAESAGTLGSDMETPATFLGERLGLESTGLSDIPEVMNSAEADDLSFLAFKDYTPTKLQGSEGVETLTGTTRKVAQYLKGKSSVTPISEDLSGDLILNKLLEGKTRKVCARMFFETLVLKSSGFVDAQQEEPYIDITLKLTSKLFKDQF